MQFVCFVSSVRKAFTNNKSNLKENFDDVDDCEVTLHEGKETDLQEYVGSGYITR